MPLHTTVFERVLHLVLFLSAGVALGVGALTALERVATRGDRTIRTRYVVSAAVTFALVFAAERVYHWLH
jgi:hypothetical protein